MNKDSNYAHEAPKEDIKEESLSEASLEQLISVLREEKMKIGQGIVDEKDSILDFPINLMNQKNCKRRGRILQVSLVSTFITAVAIVFLCVLCLRIPTNVIDYSWDNIFSVAKTEYTQLCKTESKSLHSLNKEKNAEFYWLDKLKRTNTYSCYYNNELVMIEEFYQYNNISCALYIMAKDAEIEWVKIDWDNATSSYYKNLTIIIMQTDTDLYIKFHKEMKYYIKISSLDISLLEPILSKLTQR